MHLFLVAWHLLLLAMHFRISFGFAGDLKNFGTDSSLRVNPLIGACENWFSVFVQSVGSKHPILEEFVPRLSKYALEGQAGWVELVKSSVR